MPIWLRKFTFHKIKEAYDKENAEYNKNQIDPNKKELISKPNIQPSYSTKASTKK